MAVGGFGGGDQSCSAIPIGLRGRCAGRALGQAAKRLGRRGVCHGLAGELGAESGDHVVGFGGVGGFEAIDQALEPEPLGGGA